MSYSGGAGGGGHYGLDIWTYVARLGIQMRNAGDDFFVDGDAVCKMRTCQYMKQEDNEELLHKDFEIFPCSVPGCSAKFKQLVDSETHYNSKHRHSCGTCKKNLPSAHLLDLHIQENHDSYFKLLSGKKPSFECFLEVCKMKLWTPDERREHCIISHSFPADFKFDPQPHKTRKNSSQVKRNKKAGSASPEAVKKRTSKKANGRPRPKSVYAAPITPMDTTETHIQQNYDNLKNSPTADISSSKISTSSSKLPVSSSSNTNPRRLSLSPVKPTTSVNVVDSSPMTAPVMSQMREPLSLAKMGQRITAKSTVDVSYEKMTSIPPNNIPSSGPASLDSVSLLSHKILTGTGSPATPSRIPMRRGSMTVRKTNSISSSTVSRNSSDRSLTASPIKSSQSVMSVNNNIGSSNSSSGTNSNSDLVNGNGNGGNNWREIQMTNTTHGSPNKSRIPVLRSVSCKIPKNICFGHKSNQKAFTMKHWYQNHHDSITNNERKDSLRDPNFTEDMKMALD